jgi:uncharacterized membrane protein
LETLFNILLVIHIVFGATGLILGTIIMIIRKADITHKKIGFLFFISMIINAICSLVLAYFRPNLFLFTIGIFSIYLAITGRRHLKVKIFTIQKDAMLYDWILSGTMALFGLALVTYSIIHQNLIYAFFGLLSFLLACREMYVFITKKYEPNYFLKSHIGRMIGSYITALTAFIVVNDIPYIPSIIKWIGPSIILIPLIFIWQKKYIKSN